MLWKKCFYKEGTHKMQIISGQTSFKLEQPSAVAIGKFDGLHKGHRELLEEILEAKKQNLLAAVFTFDPSPTVFFSGKAMKVLTTAEEKRLFFEKLGVDVLVEFPLNYTTAAISPEEFIEKILHENMQARLIVAGTDLSFGDKGRGNCALLKEKAAAFGYEVKIIEKLCRNEIPISSTRVREAVERGDMPEAAQLLGTPYKILGTVVHGRRIGHQIGFPTVNLMPAPDKLLPPKGVYLAQLECQEGMFYGLTNVGVKPTVETGANPPMSVETYLYDFDADIYDHFVTLRLLKFIRPEQKFEGLDALKAQLEKDIAAGRKLLNGAK